ncbi:golgin subfamily A member 3-like [Pyrus ussuriensis x Pyrus communis]|uniref:Golgin subfamily A member 3-like n=1 Tax=Pyrus ussuriensis x Pyrus communis TaxID=2448454 RepID=A0A5N5FWE9_9ROSA|nr:golgin subfamily A member 3-like [Pyrus ussuriensis x Pyrus communis]
MANSLVESNKTMKRFESRKYHSWWWDSHIGPKNSKWLADNLEEMDRSIKRMLKLVEEDGDTFAKKAEMYYQKRPELIAHVEEFYRLYRSLAERYDHVTGELRKNAPSDLQSQSSCLSDIGSELPSALPSPDVQPGRLGRRKSGPRAAGFDFFLGPGGNGSDNYQKEGDESSSLTDSEPESDDSSVNNYSTPLSNGLDHGQTRKIIELEIELREVKEKLRMLQEESVDSSFTGAKPDHSDEFPAKIAEYEQELTTTNEKLRESEEEIARLNIKLKRYESPQHNNGIKVALEPESAQHNNGLKLALEPEAAQHNNGLKLALELSKPKEAKIHEGELDREINELSEIHKRVGGSGEVQDPDSKIEALMKELRATKDRLQHSEKEIASLRQQLESNKASEEVRRLQGQLVSANKDISSWKTKFNTEKREVSKLQERISRLKNSLTDRDNEVMDLKIAVSDAEEKIFPEKAQVKAEISRLQLERTRLEEQIKDWESRARLLEDEIRQMKSGTAEMEERLNGEIAQLKADILERSNQMENLNKALDAMKTERYELSTKATTLQAEVNSRDDQINEINKTLQHMQTEHQELRNGAEGERKQVEELTERAKELEEEIQRQRVVIMEGAEEKREAIRQLCFSLEHYRNGYHRLRQACMGNKRIPVLAT